MWKKINNVEDRSCVHEWQYYSQSREFDVQWSSTKWIRDSIIEHFRACKKCGVIEQNR